MSIRNQLLQNDSFCDILFLGQKEEMDMDIVCVFALCVLYVVLMNLLGGERHVLFNHLQETIKNLHRFYQRQRWRFMDDRSYWPPRERRNRSLWRERRDGTVRPYLLWKIRKRRS